MDHPSSLTIPLVVLPLGNVYRLLLSSANPTHSFRSFHCFIYLFFPAGATSSDFRWKLFDGLFFLNNANNPFSRHPLIHLSFINLSRLSVSLLVSPPKSLTNDTITTLLLFLLRCCQWWCTYSNYIWWTHMNFHDRFTYSFLQECLSLKHTPNHSNILWIWLSSLFSALSCYLFGWWFQKPFLSSSRRRICWIWLNIGNFHDDQDLKKKITVIPKTPESDIIGELTCDECFINWHTA